VFKRILNLQRSRIFLRQALDYNSESPISRPLRCCLRRSNEDGCDRFVLVCRPKLRSFIAVSATRRRCLDFGRREKLVDGIDRWTSPLVTIEGVKDTRRPLYCLPVFSHFFRFVGQELCFVSLSNCFHARLDVKYSFHFKITFNC